jgi:hypothetical protein
MGKKVSKTFSGVFAYFYVYFGRTDPDPKHSFNIFFSVYSTQFWYTLVIKTKCRRMLGLLSITYSTCVSLQAI